MEQYLFFNMDESFIHPYFCQQKEQDLLLVEEDVVPSQEEHLYKDLVPVIFALDRDKRAQFSDQKSNLLDDETKEKIRLRQEELRKDKGDISDLQIHHPNTLPSIPGQRNAGLLYKKPDQVPAFPNIPQDLLGAANQDKDLDNTLEPFKKLFLLQKMTSLSEFLQARGLDNTDFEMTLKYGLQFGYETLLKLFIKILEGLIQSNKEIFVQTIVQQHGSQQVPLHQMQPEAPLSGGTSQPKPAPQSV